MKNRRLKDIDGRTSYPQRRRTYRHRTLWDSFVHKLKTSAIEVAILGGLGLGIGYMDAHEHETKRSKTIPLAFSEVSQIIKDREREGKELSPLNEYLPKTNDLCMKVFEAHNEANSLFSDFHTGFSQELNEHINNRGQYRFNLRDLLDQVPRLSKKILEEKRSFVDAHDQLKIIENQLYDSWSYESDDNYDLVTKTDHDGNAVVESEYSDTDHVFIYDKEKGETVYTLGVMYDRYTPGLALDTLYLASKTNEEGRRAAQESRKNEKKNTFTDNEYLQFANTWFTGSTVLLNAKKIDSLHHQFLLDLVDWTEQKEYAKDTAYNTNYRSDEGPRAYQSAQHMLATTREMNDHLNEFIVSVEKTRDDMGELESLIGSYIRNVKNGAAVRSDEKDHEKLLNEQENAILDKTKAIYRSTFKEGIDLKDYRPWFVALITLLYGVGGTAAGIGLDYAGKKTKIYDFLNPTKGNPYRRR